MSMTLEQQRALAIARARLRAGSAPQQRKSGVVETIAGGMANINRGLGIGDEIAALGGTVSALATGRRRGNPVNVFKAELADQRALEDRFATERPRAAALARGTGMAATAAIPVGGQARLFAEGGRVANAARGATLAGGQAALYAAADRGTAGERLSAASRASRDPLTLAAGAAGGALATPRRAPVAKPAQPPSNREILAQRGVSTMPGSESRTLKGVTDLGKRAPILGPAMTGYQDRQIAQLNRAVGLEALKPIGGEIPASVRPGFDMVEYVDDELGKVYTRATTLTPKVVLDEELLADAQRIGLRRADLAESEARQFDSIIADRLQRLSTGEATGRMVKDIHSELGKLQAEAARKGQQTLSDMLGETRRAVLGLVERANPEARALIRQADEGWTIYSMMNDAAAAASGRGGVFLPGQFNTQVRRAAKAMGSNMAGKGKGPLQDLSTAAMEIIPDSYGNPGTANAVGLGAGGVGLLTEPVTTMTVATGLSAAATPYFLAGRKIIERLPSNATRAELAAAQQALAELAANDPAVAALYRQVAARLSTAAGVAGGARASEAPPNVFALP